jgi:hypothetical protein
VKGDERGINPQRPGGHQQLESDTIIPLFVSWDRAAVMPAVARVAKAHSHHTGISLIEEGDSSLASRTDGAETERNILPWSLVASPDKLQRPGDAFCDEKEGSLTSPVDRRQ